MGNYLCISNKKRTFARKNQLVGSKNSLFRFWIYFRGKIGSKRGSVASYVTDCTYDLDRKETKR